MPSSLRTPYLLIAQYTTHSDLVLAPKFHWRLFLQPNLSELLCRKYPNKNIESDDTSVTVSVNQHSQQNLIRRFNRTDAP
jgi:predicted amidophosphoribosyltransferase